GPETLPRPVSPPHQDPGSVRGLQPDPRPPPPSRTVAVRHCGGGPTGVELAGAIAELARQSLAKEFRRFDPASLKLILVEAGPRILPAFTESLAAAATAKLAKLGVDVRTGAAVEKVDAEGVIVRGE